MIFHHVLGAAPPLKKSEGESKMVRGRALAIGACVSVLLGVQGCTFNGDASLGNDGVTAGTGGAEAGGSSKAGAASTTGGEIGGGGKSGTGGTTVVPSAGDGGTQQGLAGEMGDGGEQGGGPSGVCALPIDIGSCDALLRAYAFSSETGQCVPFEYGGCEGNANNFRTQTACQAACETIVCPDHLQSDTVYEVLPLNREERACVLLERPTPVSCSMLLDPSLTVPTDYGQDFCVKRDGALYYAGTTLPKDDGWEDCSPGESEIVAQAPDCKDL
jgi:hypothetical protein